MNASVLRVIGLSGALLLPVAASAYNTKGGNFDGPLHESMAMSVADVRTVHSVQDLNKDGTVSSTEMGIYLSGDKPAAAPTLSTAGAIRQGSGYTVFVPGANLAGEAPNKYELSAPREKQDS
jgi:hypothetical protein